MGCDRARRPPGLLSVISRAAAASRSRILFACTQTRLDRLCPHRKPMYRLAQPSRHRPLELRHRVGLATLHQMVPCHPSSTCHWFDSSALQSATGSSRPVVAMCLRHRRLTYRQRWAVCQVVCPSVPVRQTACHSRSLWFTHRVGALGTATCVGDQIVALCRHTVPVMRALYGRRTDRRTSPATCFSRRKLKARPKRLLMPPSTRCKWKST